MLRRAAWMLLFLLPVLLPAAGDTSASNNTLSRKKRFLVFPTNSQMTLSACLAKGGIILSPPAFVFTFDWDLAFMLPNDTRLLHAYSPAYRIHRRERRDLYFGIEGLLQRKGLDGRACVLRALCESQQVLAPGKGALMEDIFHAMFTLPPDENEFWNPDDDDLLPDELRDHDTAHRLGRASHDCAALYSSCSISLLQLALW